MSDLHEPDLRTRIVTAGRQLFSEYGYYGLSMRQIAEAVGVSKAALYYHFQDKETLFLAVLTTYLDELEAAIDRVVQEQQSGRERIRKLVRWIIAQPIEERAGIRVASQEMVHLSPQARQAFNRSYQQKFILKVQAILEAAIASGELRPVEPPIATWSLLGMLYPYFYPVFPHGAAPGVDVADQLVDIFLDGIARPR